MMVFIQGTYKHLIATLNQLTHYQVFLERTKQSKSMGLRL